MRDVFVSYSHEDREVVRLLVANLEEYGWSVWWDRHVLPGEPWSDEVETQLGQARAVLVVWSGSSVESKWVRAEARYAVSASRMIPVRIDMTAPPLEFSDIHVANLDGWLGFRDDPEFLSTVRALRACIDAVRGDEPPQEPEREREGLPPLRPADHEASDKQPFFLVYEAAFLWHGFAPPAVADHWELATEAVKRTKAELHKAVDTGSLRTLANLEWTAESPRVKGHLVRAFRRTVTPNALLNYCDTTGRAVPDFVARHPKRDETDPVAPERVP